MDTRPCSFCNHENPEDAKFCNACGSSMHLQLCKHCGAIDNLSATACYKCGASFSSARIDSDAPPESGNANAGGLADATRDRPAADSRSEGFDRATETTGSPGGRKSGAVKALALVLLAVAAVFVYRLYAPRGEGSPGAALVHDAARASPDAVDATLGAVPPSSAAVAPNVLPVTTQPLVPDLAMPPASDVAPPAAEPAASIDEAIQAADQNVPEIAPATATDAGTASPAPADGDGAPLAEHPCTPAVNALGLCN